MRIPNAPPDRTGGAFAQKKEEGDVMGNLVLDMPDWTPTPTPTRAVLKGRYARLEPLNPDQHGDGLAAALLPPAGDDDTWTYLPYGPFDGRAAFDAWLRTFATGIEPLFFAIIDTETGRADGLIAYMRIAPEDGALEIGHVLYGPAMRRTRRATETMFLLLEWAFSRGYRRVEWKCDALNERSKNAASRYGFTAEGLFRQHRVVKKKNRDTAWFALLDGEWPTARTAYERWLAPENFDADGRQKSALVARRSPSGPV